MHIWNQWKHLRKWGLTTATTVIKTSRYCIQLETNLLLYAPVILRQVGCNVPITRSWIGEVKGRGAVRSHRQDQRQTGAPECVIGKLWSCRVYDWRGTPSNMATKQREGVSLRGTSSGRNWAERLKWIAGMRDVLRTYHTWWHCAVHSGSCGPWWQWRASERWQSPPVCETSAASRCRTSRTLTTSELVWTKALTQTSSVHL